MSDMWIEASADHELEAREASLDRADAEMMPVYSFLFESRSPRELEHRLAFAAERIERVAAVCGLPAAELEETARRRYALLKEALPEGVDILAPMMDATHDYGSGAEKPDEHDEGPDFSHGYSEVPQGPPGGPAPQVVTPQLPEIPEPQQQPMQPTGSLCRCSSRLTRKGKCKACRELPGACMCRTADVTSGSPPSGPPMSSSADMPAGVGGATSTPDGMGPGGLQPSATTTSAGSGGLQLTPAQDVTAARRDPVARQVEAVAATVSASNPYLHPSECRRVARRVVGSYLRQADMASSVMSDEPWAASPGSDGGDGSGDSKGGMSGMEEYGLGKGLLSKIPGGGGGAAAGGGLAEAAELAAL